MPMTRTQAARKMDVQTLALSTIQLLAMIFSHSAYNIIHITIYPKTLFWYRGLPNPYYASLNMSQHQVGKVLHWPCSLTANHPHAIIVDTCRLLTLYSSSTHRRGISRKLGPRNSLAWVTRPTQIFHCH